MKVAEIVAFLETLFPPSLSASSALQGGARDAEVRRVVLAPLPSWERIAALPEPSYALLVCARSPLSNAWGPFLWEEPQGAFLQMLLQKRASLYVLPASYAAAPAGWDQCLAERVGLLDSKPVLPVAPEPQFKVVVFVPLEAVSQVHGAASKAGAGVIGNYTHCSFQIRGTGTFLPGEDAHPSIGQPGALERVEEIRLEMVVPERSLQDVILAMRAVHPYEEMAYDVYPLQGHHGAYGRGRLGSLPQPLSLEELIAHLEQALFPGTLHRIRWSHSPKGKLQHVAVGVGEIQELGGHLLFAAKAQGAEAVVLGGATLLDEMFAGPPVWLDVGFAPAVGPGLETIAKRIRQNPSFEKIEVECNLGL